MWRSCARWRACWISSGLPVKTGKETPGKRMQNSRKKRERKRRAFICRWVVLGSIGLLLCGCAFGANKPEKEPQELSSEQRDAEEKSDIPASQQVLEVGITADNTNPYAVAVYNAFCLKAGKGSCPIVVEFHDGRDGYEVQKLQLEALEKRGVDLLLVNVADLERQTELSEDICQAGVPVLFFGTRPKEEVLERTGGQYVGLSEEEETELGEIIEAEQFEESEFPALAEKVGEDLYQAALAAGRELITSEE